MPPFNQPDFFGEPQPDLFGGQDAALQKHQPHVPNPQHIRNRFIEFLAQMEAAATWPWDESRVETLRENTWPYLFARLPDAAEAADWKVKLEAEAARLDAATQRAA